MLKKRRVVSTFLRGSETWWTNVKRIHWAAIRCLLIALFTALAAALLYTYIKEPQIIYLIYKYLEAGAKWFCANVLSFLPIGRAKSMAEEFTVVLKYGGEVYSYQPIELMEDFGPVLLELFRKSVLWGLMGFILGILLQWAIFYRRGELDGADEVIRGSKIATTKELKIQIKRRREVGAFNIFPNLPLIKDADYRHILISGTTGTGKSTLLKWLLAQFRELGYRVVVFDSKGEFVELFFRPGFDNILNPLDDRSNFWTPWADIYEQPHVDGIASSLFPSEEGEGDDKFWTQAARLLAASGFRRLRTRDLEEYLHEVVRVDLERLSKMVEGTDAAAIINKDIHKTALNVRATIASRVQPLRYLWKYRPEYSPLSLRRFVKSDKPGWLFVTGKHDHFEGMRSLYTVWFDILTEAILSDMSGDQRKLVLVMDEFPALGRLRSIKSLMAQGRSYGACCILGFQNIHQLRQTYGAEEAENIAGLCNTWVCFSQPDPLTAKWHSDALGQIEVDEYQETVSYGGARGDLRMTPSRQIRPLVTPDQIMRLPKGSAWLRLADDYPITNVQTKVIDYPKLNPRFVQADWNRTIWGPWEGHKTASLGPARVNPGRPDLRLLA